MINPNKHPKEKLTVAECKKILSKNGKLYSENEIISIMDLLYCFAQVDIDTFRSIEEREKKFNNTLPKQLNNEIENQNSHEDNIENAA